MPLSASSAASIQIWVDSIPASTSTTTAAANSPSLRDAPHTRALAIADQENEQHRLLTTTTAIKRRRTDSCARPRKFQRRALAEMDGNRNNEEPRRSKRIAPAGNLAADRASHNDDDDDASAIPTPRPSRHAVLVPSASRLGRSSGGSSNVLANPPPPTPVFLPRNPPTLAESSLSSVLGASSLAESPTRSDTSRSSASAFSTSTAGGKRREKSPVKNTTSLRITERPVRFVAPSSHAQLPSQVRELHARLNSIKRGKAIIPQSMKSRLIDILRANHDDDEIDTFNLYSDSRNNYTLQRELDDVTDIVQAALLAKHKHGTEASWNSTVHTPLFRTAFRTTPGVHFHDVTSVQADSVFLPTHEGSGVTLQSRLVDYTFNLEPRPDQVDRNGFERRIEKLFRLLPASQQSMTQTMYEVTLMRPAAVSVETKGDKGTDNEAKVQLGLWVATHFNKLDSLQAAAKGRTMALDVGEVDKMPLHPIIIANPDKIAIMYAVLTADVEAGDSRGIDIFSGPEIPAPVTHVDAYRCVQILRCLAEWADTQYRDWVERKLLQ